MSEENNVESIVIVEVTPPTTNQTTETAMMETDDLKRETQALLEAIKKRAQDEAQSASTLTRETYVSAVRRAREAIEGDKLIERDKIENTFDSLQHEAAKNLEYMMKQLAELGDRFHDAAQAAWTAFNAPRHS